MRKEDFLRRIKKGRTFTFDTFASTSTRKGVAHDFIRSGQMNYPDAESVMFRIEGTQTRGVDIHRLSGLSDEKEILLRKGQKFRIKSVMREEHRGRSYWEVILEEVQ
jgi:hypothetical protein